MRVLITGGTGFIGSALARTLLRAGHDVAVLARGTTTRGRGFGRWLLGSVAEPPWNEIAAFAPEACIHAAWVATPGIYLESDENHNWVRWSEAFLTRLATLDVAHVTVLGTCIEYGIDGRRLHEERSPLAPASTYARCKCALHERLRSGPLGSRLAWARVFYPYGEGEHPARLASSILAKLDRGERVTLRTPGSTKDYIHIDDLASGLQAVVEQRLMRAINLGTGEGTTVEALARAAAKLAGRPELIDLPENPPVDPLDYVVADAGRLRALGWAPRVTLEEGLARLRRRLRP